MISRPLFCLVGCFVAAALWLWLGEARGVEVPNAPPLSTLAPVEDLVGEVESYVEELEDCVEDLDEYEDSVEKIERYSNTLAVVALAIGLHDQDSGLRKAAPALIQAAQVLAKAKDFAGAKAGVAGVKAALSANGDPASLKWSKIAQMQALMKQVPLVNTRLKRYMRRFDKGAPMIAAGSAALVAIGHGSLANSGDTVAPDKVAEWYKYCIDMRDAAGDLNRAARNNNEDAAKQAMEALQQSCDDCHVIFHPDEL